MVRIANNLLKPAAVEATRSPAFQNAPRSTDRGISSRMSLGLCLGLFLTILAAAGCGKDVAKEASDSDSNGYLCLKCGAKFYTARSVFLATKCSKCQQDGLVEVIGYECPKDKHVTIRGRTNDRNSAPVCEQCQGPLGGMVLPREKDLKTWGATKVSS